jgi:hypothetical protein
MIKKLQHSILQQQQRAEQLERSLAAANKECEELNELVMSPSHPPNDSIVCIISLSQNVW